MSDANVLNRFHQPEGNSAGGPKDNPLQLAGTVLQADGTQAAFIADATDPASTQALVNSLKQIMINTGLMAPS